MTYFNSIKYSDSGNLDAFARLRVSTPFTLFDSKQVVDNAPLFWDQVTNGSASTVWVSGDSTTVMNVTNNGDYVVRQTKSRFNYQPGKSQLIICTGVMNVTGANVVSRIGYFNSSTTAPYSGALTGLYFENNAGTVSVNVAKNGVISKFNQSAWNVDNMLGGGGATNPSGITLNWANAQIWFIDFEWLGVGRVRYGVFVNGGPYYVHQVLNSNNITSVYMTTPNHSVRYEIRSTGGAGSLSHICSTVQSEGGFDQNGLNFSAGHAAAAALTTNSGNLFPLVGIQLKQGALGSTVIPKLVSLINSVANADFKWSLIINPTITGTFTYADVANSSIQVATNTATGTTAANGTVLESGFISNTQDSLTINLENAVRIGCNINGTADQLVLCIQRNTATNPAVSAIIVYRDLF